jgi:hypothetical protein
VKRASVQANIFAVAGPWRTLKKYNTTGLLRFCNVGMAYFPHFIDAVWGIVRTFAATEFDRS